MWFVFVGCVFVDMCHFHAKIFQKCWREIPFATKVQIRSIKKMKKYQQQQTNKNWQKMCMTEKPRKQFFCADFNTSSILNSFIFTIVVLVLLPLFDTFTSVVLVILSFFPPQGFICMILIQFDGYFVAVCCLNYPGIQIEISLLLTASCRHSNWVRLWLSDVKWTEIQKESCQHTHEQEKKKIHSDTSIVLNDGCQCWKLLN